MRPIESSCDVVAVGVRPPRRHAETESDDCGDDPIRGADRGRAGRGAHRQFATAPATAPKFASPTTRPRRSPAGSSASTSSSRRDQPVLELGLHPRQRQPVLRDRLANDLDPAGSSTISSGSAARSAQGGAAYRPVVTSVSCDNGACSGSTGSGGSAGTGDRGGSAGSSGNITAQKVFGQLTGRHRRRQPDRRQPHLPPAGRGDRAQRTHTRPGVRRRQRQPAHPRLPLARHLLEPDDEGVHQSASAPAPAPASSPARATPTSRSARPA